MNDELTLIDLGDATVETREKPGPREDSIGEPDLFGVD